MHKGKSAAGEPVAVLAAKTQNRRVEQIIGEKIGMDNSPFEITAGSANFVSKKFGGTGNSCRFSWGWIQYFNFRAWLGYRHDTARPQYTDFKFGFTVFPRKWINNDNEDVSSSAGDFGDADKVKALNMRQTPRIAIEARYQGGGTGSYYFILHYNGMVQLKRRCCGMYYRSIIDETSQKYRVYPEALKDGLQFSTKYRVEGYCKGDTLKFYINGKLVFTGKDKTLSWGALGIRTDMMDAYLSKVTVEEAA